MNTGRLRIHVFKGYTSVPVENAKITVIQNKEATNRQTMLCLFSDSSGVTNNMELETPPLEYSLKPSDKQPYSLCKIIVEAPGYNKLTINGCQIYPGITSIQSCYLNSISTGQRAEDILNISANTLYGDYPSKIPEIETPSHYKSATGESFAIVPSEQKIPVSLIVHDGKFDDPTAPDFSVYYKEYIKNVLASEIYSTWHPEAIKANAYAIISFTLNRIFTEWYIGKGEKYHITSSTATDHKYTRGKNTSTVDMVVNEIFSTYIQKPNYEFPLLAQYTDGIKVGHRKGWMAQWGSQNMASEGRTALEILQYFYGSNITLFKIEKMVSSLQSFPGYSLQIGSTGEPIKIIQKFLNSISKNYPLISKVSEDGIFGKDTKRSVETFQGIFSIPKTGKVDYVTWYRISDIYVALVK